MPFLLLLSALLTALTGVVTGARPADVQIARHVGATRVAEVAAAARPLVAAHAHLTGGFGSTASFAVAGSGITRVVATLPLYIGRLRV